MWPDCDETKQLLHDAGAGDAEAVNRLLERHRQSLRRLVHLRLDRALAGRVDASDVVQDVMLEASRRLDDFIRDAKLPFHLWLRQLARDRIIDMHRRHRAAKRRSVDREQSLAAPEQAAGRRGRVTAATDIYGLGAVLYAMLTGRAPFQAASPLDAVMLVLEQDPLPPRVLNRRVDSDLEMIALKCLQKPAELRYASASDLAADLSSYLAGEPIAARSSHFSQVITRAFRETHHAAVLENWGLLWMWHSLVLLVLCLVTNALQWQGIVSRWPYLALWGGGLGVWAGIFWNLRHRAGPVTFVERQIAHVWAGSMIVSTGLYCVEWILDLPVLQLSPVLGLVSGMVFLVKGGILSGAFYTQAVALFATAAAMAWLQSVSRASGMVDVGISLFGVVAAACFFFPGLKYYRQQLRQRSAR